MDKTSRRKVQYKKTDDGLDRRALRAHRRSVEWKSLREDSHNDRRRNLSDDLSPLKEVPSRPPTPPRQIPIDPMRIKLEKWQAKRELQKQIEKRTNPKKPIFKCTALKPEEYDVTKLKAVKIKPVEAAPTSAPKTRATRASNKAAPATRQPAPAPTRTTRIPSTRVPVTEPTTQRGRTTRTRKPAAEPVPTGRVTRSRSAAIVTAQPPKPEPKPKRTSRKPVAEVPPAKPQKVVSSRMPLILNPVVPAVFDFKPLSPRSVESYLNPVAAVNEERGCSTPKDPVTYRLRETPALSAIPPSISQSAEASSSMNRESPILKIANVVKHSPVVRRSSRRSVRNLPIVEDIMPEETPAELRAEKTETTRVSEDVESFVPVTEEVEDSVFEPAATTSTTVAEVDPAPGTNDSRNKENLDEKVEEKNCTAESAPGEPETEQIPFRTPRTATKAQRRRTTSAILALGNSAHRTPKALRQSFILRHLSPEEGVEVLKMSPMIEMDRRKRKSGSSPYRPNPLPSFDDIDDIIPPEPQQVSTEKQTDVVTKQNSVTPSDPPAVEPLIEEPMETDTAIPVTPAPVDVAPVPEAPTSAEVTVEQPEPAEEKHDVPYFRSLLVSQTERINTLCATWENVLTSSKLTEEDEGEIRTSIGKAQLLVAQRFKQFRGLVDNCEFNTGEKETTCEDLGGFWDMVYFQVEDIEKMFDTLEKLQANGWQREKPKVVKKKVLKKKPAAVKPAVKGRSNFRMFMAIKKKMEDEKPAAANVDEDPSLSTSEAATQEAVPSISEVAPVEKAPSTPAMAKVTEAKEETAPCEVGAANLEVPVVIPPMGEALEAGIFMTRSPAKTPREYSKGNTPCRRSGRTLGITPSAVTPLMRSLLERNARRSTGANSIPKQAPRKSETTTDESQRRLSASEQSVRSKRALNSTTPSISGEKESCVVTAEEDVSTQQIQSFPVCLETAPSLFTPETGSRRSSRLSEANHSLMETSARCDENNDPFLKYLQPTVQEHAEEEPKEMEQGSPTIEDVDMAATMKRDLISEFNAHAASAKKRHSLGPSSRGTPTRQMLPSEEKLSSSATRRNRRRSGAASNRRSVQFNFVALPEDEAEATNKVPGTPANRRRLDEQKENLTPVSSGKSAVVDTETPATKLARLCVRGDDANASPARSKRRAYPSLLYTPTQEISDVSIGEVTDNLISFSPLPESSSMNLTDVGNKTPVGRTRRRSNRLSLL